MLPRYRNWLGRPSWSKQHGSHSAQTVDQIRRVWSRISSVSSRDLVARANALRNRILQGANLSSISVVVPAFALTAEAIRRTTGKSLFDVQLAGGLALAVGAIAEIQTGEGKTLVAALPAVLHGLSGKGVHVATTSDYLSERDYQELRPAYELLGLSTGLIRPQARHEEKCLAYACEIIYGPGYEFGFDYLRDQLSLRSRFVEPLGARHLQKLRGQQVETSQLAQRGHPFAIIDEADSVLIDEATTPLILSGGDTRSTSSELYDYARQVALNLDRDVQYSLDDSKRTVAFTPDGQIAIHRQFHSRPSGHLARPWGQLVEQALRAEYLLIRDEHYVLKDGAVAIVDQHTGRIHDDRRWRAGLHQAVEVKEGLDPTNEKLTQARITRQRFTRLYDGVCGLTGTARDAESEFREFYGLPVVTISPHRPCVRKQLPTRWFGTAQQKLESLAEDVALRSRGGQPVLVGTQSIRESRAVAEALRRHDVEHTVLNGMQDADEAAIIARAGMAGVITVATNMAGRGTDIRLDSASHNAGGLHVAATNRHESRRVDRQLMGRAARQGDPGSCGFWISADDPILHHAPSLQQRLRDNVSAKSGETLVGFDNEMSQLQQRLEDRALEDRRRMVANDDWLESVQSTLARRA